MLRSTRLFLTTHGVQALVLDGNMSQRAKTLDSLTRGGVLLLCLEENFAGLHLPYVEHVIFAHAIVGDQDKVDLLEKQAIARCQRYGQLKPVQVYSFLVIDSEETYVFSTTH